MTLTFLPSLEHLAAVRVALIIYNDDIIHLFDEWLMVHKVDRNTAFNMRTKQERWMQEVEEKARNILSELLPKPVINQIAYIFQPLVDEIYFWVRDHIVIVKHIEKSHNANTLHWTSEGTIDRAKMAKQLIRNENIEKRVRFAMACIYFRENDVLNLWQSMTAVERQGIFQTESNIAVLFWMRWLRENGASPWTQCVKKYLDSDFNKTMIIYDTEHKIGRVRLSSFFNELNTFCKKYFFLCYWPDYVHFDDIRLCYRLVDEDIRAEIFHSHSKTGDVLSCYLDWPLQTLFLDTINKMKSYLKSHCFRHYLHYIIYYKLLRGKQDFDYLQLLRDLWDRIPDEDKEKIRKKSCFIFLYAAMSYDEKTYPLPIEEFLMKCYNFVADVEAKS
ncbi:hypothetical protein AVEN_269009-1 [Araneus ventricosus]|uniref:Uncharacterized protein n=1 Tax=Araneus ventricosus TaxID=182803 RepID=A0A4Y2PQN8_ARAVE|nr:hypothetical protein AVEN_269009-1 [Araneus ventricosus]